MALIGNCSNTTFTDHETELDTWTYTNTEDEVVSVEQPKKVANTTNYENVYLCIRQINLMPQCCTGDGQSLDVIFIYAAYESVEARNADPTNFLFDGTGLLFNYDHDSNLYTQVYDLLKTKEGFTNLTNG